MAPIDTPKYLVPRFAATATTIGPSVYLGLGLGVGGALLLAIIIVVVQVVKKHREHRGLIEILEVEEALRSARAQEIGETARPASAVRRSSLNPLNTRAGWDELSSTETINELGSERRKSKRKRSSISLPKRIKQRGIPLKKLKRLTAILESPRSRNTSPPVILQQSEQPTTPTAEQRTIAFEGPVKPYTMRKVGDDVFICPGSPKPDVLPSFAIRSPGQYGAGIASQENTKASRSRSVGALAIPDMQQSDFTIRPVRPSMHSRSVSLGALTSGPPSCPVPPLPTVEPHARAGDNSARQGLCVSRTSSSSRDSTGSSVLVSSPILIMHDQSMSSPSLAQIVAEDDDASLKAVSMRTWDQPLVKRIRTHGTRNLSKSEASIRSNMARYSIESLSSDHILSTQADVPKKERRRLSIPQTDLAAQISISRVSSSNSINSHNGIQKILTPRKPKRSSVSASGSPAERRKTSILREVSGNSLGPSRQPSTATQDSGRSSNGNPFQWDQPLPKPSALKGSPNARRGHRRQNCVRISTLTPQILGPPPSRPTSPNIMHGIEEESSDHQDTTESTKLRFVTNHRLSRPVSSGSFAPNLRIQTLRASLTPSSPTLSAWNAYQEHGLPSLPSDSQISMSPITRSCSRLSDRSSPFTIPSFPSPSKATLTEIQMNQGVPQFCLSRPSSERDEVQESSSPFGLQLSSDRDIPSSPPVSKHDAYDPVHPVWSSVTFDRPRETEYDPASPSWLDGLEPEKSSPLFPFAATAMDTATPDAEEFASQAALGSFGSSMSDSPPCSPKTIPDGIQEVFDKQISAFNPLLIAEERLTSSNASAIMARLPNKAPDFPGAPILSPPEEPDCYLQTTPHRPLPQPSGVRQRAVSNAVPPHPLHYAPPPPMPTIPSSDIDPDEPEIRMDVDIPPPLNLSTKSTPLGPRSQPPQSVLKNAMALRRMNSEVNQIAAAAAWDSEHRESRQYVRMGREASPLLPWIGDVETGDESVTDINALFDFGFTAADAMDDVGGAEEANDTVDLPAFRSALDEIDLAVVERRLDGALSGFDATVEVGSDDNRHSDERTIRNQEVCSGEEFWQGKEWSGFGAREGGMDNMTPKKRDLPEDGAEWRRRSVQMTPKSLYDSDGFYRGT